MLKPGMIIYAESISKCYYTIMLTTPTIPLPVASHPICKHEQNLRNRT
jgi:hypothetical protein